MSSQKGEALKRSFSFSNNSKYLSYVYLAVIILLGIETFISRSGDGPLLVVRSYWDTHGVFLLAFLAMFPRFALFFSSIASGGLLWWLGWLFAPRLLVAFLATEAYLQTNPFLVAVAWIIAFSGEFSEKEFMRRRSTTYFDSSASRQETKQEEDETIIEAEFKNID